MTRDETADRLEAEFSALLARAVSDPVTRDALARMARRAFVLGWDMGALEGATDAAALVAAYVRS